MSKSKRKTRKSRKSKKEQSGPSLLWLAVAVGAVVVVILYFSMVRM